MMDDNEINKLCSDLSLEIDRYIYDGDIINIKNMDLLCDQYILEYPQIAAVFWYYKSNIAAALYQLPASLNVSDNIESKTQRVRVIQIDPGWKQLLYLRQAIQGDSFQKCPIELKAMIFTNLGSAFRSVGRFIEAIECFNQAIACIPIFGVALYSRGNTFYQLANWLALNHEINADQTPIDFLYAEAKKSFDLAFKEGSIWETHPDHVKAMRKKYDEHLLPHIQETQSLEFIKGYKLNSDDFFKGSCEENAYKKWSLKENLYLDPINLVSVYDIGGYDYLSFPPYSYRQGEEQPEFFNWFRLLKQEYIAARYLLFQSIQLKDKKHFADENSDLFPSNEAELKRSDNSGEIRQNDFSFGLATSLMKSSFSKVYSIFDKIAEFIFAFWEVDVDSKKNISIATIWYNNFDVKQGVNAKLINQDNWFLKGLYHLSYDLVGKEIAEEYILPEFKRLHEIRNKLEHSGVMITKEINTSSSQRLMTISLEEFVEHNLSLLRLVRNALFYLSLAASLDQWNDKKRMNNTYQEND